MRAMFSLVAAASMLLAACAPGSSTPAASTAPTVKVTNNAGLGQIMMDGQGRSLYAFTGDQKNKSNCTGSCVST